MFCCAATRFVHTKWLPFRFYHNLCLNGIKTKFFPRTITQYKQLFTASKQLSSISVTFITPNGDQKTATGREGDTLLDVVRDNTDQLDLDGFGACDGELACCSCHVVLRQEDFDRLPNPVCELEMDMLELAPQLMDTSRLGCQVKLASDIMPNGLEVIVPGEAIDARLLSPDQKLK